jgi:hypothetical protein
VICPDVLFISKIQLKMLLQIWSYAFQVRFGVLLHRIRSKVDDSALNMDFLRRIKVVVNDEKTATNSLELVAMFWGTRRTVGGGGDIRLGIDF